MKSDPRYVNVFKTLKLLLHTLQVQQDMLRPKSAMSYIEDIENISSDFLDLVQDSLDEKNEVPDLLDLVNMFALESIVIIFLDQRLGCLQKNLPDNSDAKSFVNAVKVVTGHDGNELAGGMPIWKIYPTGAFKRFDKASIQVNDISKKYVDSAIKKLENSNVTNYDDMSVLQKLIKRCGPGSQIPLGNFLFQQYCQALVPNPKPISPQSLQTQSQPSPTQFETQINPKGTGADTKIL